MKIEIDGLDGGFWVRNALRALLAWLWFDHGRWLAFSGTETYSAIGIEFIILVSVVITFALEAIYQARKSGEGESSS